MAAGDRDDGTRGAVFTVVLPLTKAQDPEMVARPMERMDIKLRYPRGEPR